MNLKQIITNLPVGNGKKIKIYRNLMYPYWSYMAHKASGVNYDLLRRCLIQQNSFYGHEYWIKQFAYYNEGPIYAIIDHGITFEDDREFASWDAEISIGSFLTFGESKRKILSNLFPDHRIVPIGPRLHYVDIDEHYYREIKNKLDPTSKTMVLYPSHSVEKNEYIYDVDLFYQRALDFANEYKIKNVIISLHPADIAHGIDKKYLSMGKNIVLVTGGRNGKAFLPRLKAILSIADITYSNKFGTHIGYSVYMGKPHIVDSTSDSKNNDWQCTSSVINREEELFSKTFSGDNPWIISKEQQELIDYYFGISSLKSKEELYNEIQMCKKHFYKNFY